jgi:predicted lipid-binding transport protein (Tim44 family)
VIGWSGRKKDLYMGGGFGIFEIILFAGIAAFLVYRLGSVLGKRTGHERSLGNKFGRRSNSDNDNVVTLPERSHQESDNEEVGPTSVAAGVTQLQAVNPSFDEEQFTEGAKTAFALVIKAFATGDGKTLRALLSDEVYENFAKEIRAREIANYTHETDLVSISAAEIIEVHMEGSGAFITTRFISEQVNATRDSSGDMVEGESEIVAEVTDIWTFARETRSSDPNWTLVATRSPG